MRTFVILSCLFLAAAGDSANSQDTKNKNSAKNTNSISITSPKQEQYYQQYQYQAQPQYVQIIPKPLYVPGGAHQPNMIIIAQPAYVPANVLYGSATQQLLNYFHSNPQARYQLLHGQYPQQQYVPQVTSSQTVGNYQVVAAPAHYSSSLPSYQQTTQLHAVPSQVVQSEGIPFQTSHLQHPQIGGQYQTSQQPMQLNQIAHLAQLAAQHYLNSPGKTAPAIVTGFENFTPEQQTQIKAQLSAHLGNPIGTITGNSLQQQSQQTQHQQPTQVKSQYLSSLSNNNPYSSRYQAQTRDEFVPSQQIKSGEDMITSGIGNQELLKTQYLKM